MSNGNLEFAPTDSEQYNDVWSNVETVRNHDQTSARDSSALLDFSGMSFSETDLNLISDVLANNLMPFSSVMADGLDIPAFLYAGSAPSSLLPSNIPSTCTSMCPADDLSSCATPYIQEAPNTSVIPSLGQLQASASRVAQNGPADRREIGELAARARQIVALNSAADSNAIVHNRVPIPRLHPSANARGTSVLSGQSPGSPSSPDTSTNTRTKVSHSAVERRYRANFKQHLADLREVVPALRVLELNPGNRISNLSFKPGTRRVGVDVLPGTEGDDIIDERGYIDGVKVARNGSKTTAILKAVEYIRVLKRRETRLKHEQEGLKVLVRSFPGGPELLLRWETTWRDKYGSPEKEEVGEEGSRSGSQIDGDQVDGANSPDDDGDESGRECSKRMKSSSSTPSSDKERKTFVSASPSADHGLLKNQILIKPMGSRRPPANSSSVHTPAKRKRGRPRKILTSVAPQPGKSVIRPQQRPLAIAPTPEQSTSDNTPPNRIAKDAQTGQYVLATFVFVSFFASPIRFYSPAPDSDRGVRSTNTYSGSVFGDFCLDRDSCVHPSRSRISFRWNDESQSLHLAVLVSLVLFIMWPRVRWFGRFSLKLLNFNRYRPSFVAGSPSTSSFISVKSLATGGDRAAGFRAAADKLREMGNGRVVPRAVEAQMFREGLDLKPGILGLSLTFLSLFRIPELHEHWRLERRVFTRLIELVALDASSTISDRLQMFMRAFRFHYGHSYSATEIASLALVIYPIWRAKAVKMWEDALARVHGRSSSPTYIYEPYDFYVLENMSIDEAVTRLRRIDEGTGSRIVTLPRDQRDGVCKIEISKHRTLASPLAVLTRQAILERVRSQAERTFFRTITGEQNDVVSEIDEIDDDRLMAIGHSLDPLTVSLLDQFEQICNRGSKRTFIEDSAKHKEVLEEWESYPPVDPQLQTLLNAIALLGETSCKSHGDQECLNEWSDAIAQRSSAQMSDLKRCLGSLAFERMEALNDCRSRLLDLLHANSDSANCKLKGP